MTTNAIEILLADLFEQWSGQKASLILPLAPSGSDRIYYRLQGGGKSVIGTYNRDQKENEAFLSFSRHFHQQKLSVPEIYFESDDRKAYLQEDLGSTTLYSYLLQRKPGEGFPDFLINLYKKVVRQLPLLQIKGGEGLDYSKCYPRQTFDRQSMLWDLNTFKYYFLKLAKIPFDEQALEDDFHKLADYLLQTDCSNFMFRDFQTRNILIKGGEPFFVDYQGGRKGALQYDLASLLFQAKANIPPAIREQLLAEYLDAAASIFPLEREAFIRHYYGYVLIRSIQVCGSYGFRGLYERKQHFLSSIPFAIKNIKWLLENVALSVEIPELLQALKSITEAERFTPFDRNKGEKSLLTVRINSFSYKFGIPEDPSSNGGGFVFDCRFLHNPGRYEPYKRQTGRDEPVINFLKQHSEMEPFLNNIYHIVDGAISNYIERSFTSLSVNFGCTGGQHRSVYAADCLSNYIENKFGVKVELCHREQERKGWKN